MYKTSLPIQTFVKEQVVLKSSLNSSVALQKVCEIYLLRSYNLLILCGIISAFDKVEQEVAATVSG